MIKTFNKGNFKKICNQLAASDADLKSVIDTYGYPPMWTRPNSFESLVHIILEQQVSLASAKAALDKIKERLPEVTPETLLILEDDELRSSYFSRQKTLYVRHLATALVNKHISLVNLQDVADEVVRSEMIKLKGIGNWTIDIYLMFCLQRADLFPIGDLAAVNAIKEIKKLPISTTRDEIIAIAANWEPYRTVATMILWHYYLSKRKKK